MNFGIAESTLLCKQSKWVYNFKHIRVHRCSHRCGDMEMAALILLPIFGASFFWSNIYTITIDIIIVRRKSVCWTYNSYCESESKEKKRNRFTVQWIVLHITHTVHTVQIRNCNTELSVHTLFRLLPSYSIEWIFPYTIQNLSHPNHYTHSHLIHEFMI